MNFTTDLPKNYPICSYLVATGKVSNECYRMHVVVNAQEYNKEYRNSEVLKELKSSRQAQHRGRRDKLLPEDRAAASDRVIICHVLRIQERTATENRKPKRFAKKRDKENAYASSEDEAMSLHSDHDSGSKGTYRGERRGDFVSFQPKRRKQVKADSAIAQQMQEAELVPNRRLTRATRALIPEQQNSVPENPEDEPQNTVTVTEESKEPDPADVSISSGAAELQDHLDFIFDKGPKRPQSRLSDDTAFLRCDEELIVPTND